MCLTFVSNNICGSFFINIKNRWIFSSFSEGDSLMLNISIYLRYIAFHSLKVLFIVISIFAFHHNRQSSFKFFISAWLRVRSLEIIRYMCDILYYLCSFNSKMHNTTKNDHVAYQKDKGVVIVFA